MTKAIKSSCHILPLKTGPYQKYHKKYSQWRFFFILASSKLCTVNIYLKDNFGSGSRSQIISALPATAPQHCSRQLSRQGDIVFGSNTAYYGLTGSDCLRMLWQLQFDNRAVNLFVYIVTKVLTHCRAVVVDFRLHSSSK